MRIREGNDFKYNWAIEKGGVPESISSATRKLLLRQHKWVREIEHEVLNGNVIHIDITTEMTNGLGDYILELHYIDAEGRSCAVDTDAFTIVARTEMADDILEFSKTSDIAVAMKGRDAYEVWVDAGNVGSVDDYLDWVQEPAVVSGNYAKEQGDYAKGKGDYAKEQGEYAKEQGNYAKEQGDYVLGLQVLSAVDYSDTNDYNEI